MPVLTSPTKNERSTVMAKEKKWFEKLTKNELVHLIGSASESKEEALLTALKNNLAAQAKEDFHCYQCRRIARKLGIELP
jgi:hypothetical protein